MSYQAYGNKIEVEARSNNVCVCGKAKELNSLVCWDCFKLGDLPLKYFEGGYSAWLEARKTIGVK